MSDNRDRTNPAKKRRLGIHEPTLENDIRYLGPLNAQHFKLLGWLCIVISQVAVIVKMGGRLDPGYATDSASLLSALGYIADLALPFLLIALGFRRGMGALSVFRRHRLTLQRFGGGMLIALGVLMITGVWNIWINNLQGWLDSVTLPI